MLVSRRQKQKERILVAETTRDAKKLEADTLAKSIDARRDGLAAQIREIVILQNRTSEDTPRDIASLDRGAEYAIAEFQELEEQMKRARQELDEFNEKRRKIEETRAKMLNTLVRPLAPEHSNAEIDRCRAKMDTCCDNLRKIEAAKAKISDETEQLPDLVSKRKASLEAKMESLADKRRHVYDDYDDACRILENILTDYVKLERSLILAEMLPDYEKYWTQYLSRDTDTAIDELWDNIKYYGDRSNKPRDESNEDVALVYFAEYLHTLVEMCNRHHCDKFKSPWDEIYTTFPYGADFHGVLASNKLLLASGIDFTIHSVNPPERLDRKNDCD